jgi:hypothetical protein
MDRRRAPHREGHRTTLKVPHEVLDEAAALAREMGTTPNDAIVRLAEEGLAARRRRRRTEEIAQARRAAVARVGFEDAINFPPAETLREAMLSGRRDDD